MSVAMMVLVPLNRIVIIITIHRPVLQDAQRLYRIPSGSTGWSSDFVSAGKWDHSLDDNVAFLTIVSCANSLVCVRTFFLYL